MAANMAAPANLLTSGIYAYVAVKASLHADITSVFGLNDVEISALSKRFDCKREVINGVTFKAPPMTIVNSLSQIGYKLISSTGETEIVWTMQRDL